MKKLKAAAALAGMSVFGAGTAQALVAPIGTSSTHTVTTTSSGPFVATFLGSSAGLFNTVFFVNNGTETKLFDKSTPAGTTVDLGSFAAGTELTFRLFVQQTAQSFFTGPASANFDNFQHARVDVSTFPGSWLVGFEDLLRGGDKDFNDLVFTVAPADASTPLPGAALLLLSGIAGAAGVSRLRKKKA
jgi:hypothetical protein